MKPKVLRSTVLSAVLLAVVGSSCAHRKPITGGDASTDPYLWLEQIEDPVAISWVKSHNERTLGVLEGDPRYKPIEREVRRIVLAKDRIPFPSYFGGSVYNFWQDEKSVRGLWRRTSLSEYGRSHPKWETVLDVDRLAAGESENWVWKGADCLAPDFTRCVIKLSRGGKDAAVMREFDTKAKAFVKGGFELAEAKSDYAWLDADRLLVGTDWGPGSLTDAGYARTVKVWTRGTPLASARELITVPKSYDSVGPAVFFEPGASFATIVARPSFFEEEAYRLDPKTLALTRLELPRDSHIVDYFHGQLLVRLRSPWLSGQAQFPAGALVSVDTTTAVAGAARLVYAPDARSSIQGVSVSRGAVLITTLENVTGRLLRAVPEGNGWSITRAPLPRDGIIGIASSDAFTDVVLTSYESFLTPPAVLDGARALKRLPAKFDARGMVVEQFEATSRDGTKVPYFVIHRKSLKLDGANPTLLYAYGGFEIPMTPSYAAVLGRVWLRQGGVYVLANIRGGGEFGPAWHQAALKANRQRAYDDFISVGEDLVRRKLTNPSRLGIMGGSNGGLLMGAAFTQRPDLFGAVVCKVPLLDMLRYNQLLAGHSWEAEYGDPDDPALREAILGYSPYQRVRAAARYPEVFFETSTKDDRVHPGHARKMVARMEAFGHHVYYFENTEGGHGAAANLEQKIHMISLDYTYLSRKLGVNWVK